MWGLRKILHRHRIPCSSHIGLLALLNTPPAPAPHLGAPALPVSGTISPATSSFAPLPKTSLCSEMTSPERASRTIWYKRVPFITLLLLICSVFLLNTPPRTTCYVSAYSFMVYHTSLGCKLSESWNMIFCFLLFPSTWNKAWHREFALKNTYLKRAGLCFFLSKQNRPSHTTYVNSNIHTTTSLTYPLMYICSLSLLHTCRVSTKSSASDSP